ncbi:MAG: chromosome segregation protein SMC [Planctomycetota bacterium]
MYLKKLTLSGFKSFADPTDFHFHEGTTAVVGPNGCGKSNIVDAFRWVLGERRAKELRGSEMLDVIFNGAGKRDPMSRAEVSLTFDNTDNSLPLDHSEVEVARRLYRSGESEYLINRKKCRLKDVLALFSDTGIGAHGYSVLEQGNVDGFLHSNPVERRAIFEEAAGVSRYKKQKLQSMRQLDRTEQNLQRLHDIFGEVEKRIRSVKIQAGKAARFLEDQELVRQLRTVVAEHDIARFRAERENLTYELYQLETRRDFIESASVGVEAEQQMVADAVEESRQELAALREREMEIRVALEGAQQRTAHIDERCQELEATFARREGQRSDLLQVEAEYEAGRQELRDGLRGELQQLRQVRDVFAGAEEARAKLVAERTEHEDRIQEAKEEALSLLYSETKSSNERTSLESDLRGLQALSSRRQGELSDFERELEELQQRQGELQKERDTAGNEEQRLRLEQRAIQSEIERRVDLLSEANQELSALQDRFSKDQARLRSLEELEERREGVGRGVRRLLSSDQPLARDVIGLLADEVEVAAEHAPMVDAVLGSFAEMVMLQGGTPLEARARVIDTLLDGDGMTFCQIEQPQVTRDSTDDGGPLRLVSLLRCEPRQRALLECIFGDVRVVEDVDEAMGLCRNGSASRYVTRAGAIVEPWGAVSLPSKNGAGLVSRRSEIHLLRGSIAEQGTALHQAEERGSSLQHAIEARREEAGRLDAEARRRALERESLQRKWEEAHRNVERVNERRETIVAELEDLQRSQQEKQHALEQVVAQLAELQEQRQQREIEARELEGQLESLAATAEEREQEVSRLRVQGSQLEERIVGVRREERRLVGEIGERQARRQHLEEEEAEDRQRIEQYGAERVQLAERTTECEAGLEEIEAGVTAAGDTVAARQGEQRDIEQLMRAVRSEENRLRTLREEMLVRDNEASVRMTGLREKLLDDFEIDLREAPIDEWRELLLKEDEEVNDDFFGRLQADLDAAVVRLRKNANVNLEAVNELEELEERHGFLETQMADLADAREKLLETIESLNTRCREMFVETFEVIRTHFKELFTTIFGGGIADLQLEAEVDPLEAGIEVIARPPGKKITSLKLLSGGEKALTAISVLFALFRTKPSPFCILDEVDAPLDEANIRRFVRALHEFIDDTQFLIVTHSKVTMSKAERLYGITMEERGVSRTIAVELEEVEGMGLIEEPFIEDAPASSEETDADAQPAAVEEVSGDAEADSKGADEPEEAAELVG